MKKKLDGSTRILHTLHMISEYDKSNIDAIIAGNHGDWFTAQLLRLIAKADSHNRRMLAKGFPEEVRLVSKWQGIEVGGE